MLRRETTSSLRHRIARRTIQRSVVTALYTLKGGKVKVHIHKSLPAAALMIAPLIGKPASAIVQALRPKENA